MTERSDITTYWEESPRIIEVADPSANLTMQDLHDTCRSDSKQPGEGGDSLNNMDDDFIIDSAGKEDLGGGVSVGITATLQNAQVAFESRITPTSTGSVTTGDVNGVTYTDASGTLQTDSVERGAVLINFTDESITEILEVLGEGSARCRPLRGGTNNDFGIGDVCKIWNIEQCELEGGNLVALNEADASISPVFPTAFTQIVRTSSSSATLQELQDIQYSSFGGGVTVDTASGFAGTTFPTGTPRQPVDNLTDALSIANERGFTMIYLESSLTIPSGLDFTGFTFQGQSAHETAVVLAASASLGEAGFEGCVVSGDATGVGHFNNCNLNTLTNYNAEAHECGLETTITLASSGSASFIDCYSLVPGTGTPEIIQGSGCSLKGRNYAGGIELSGKTGTDACSFDMNSGQFIAADDNTTGAITVRGVAKWTNRETYAGTATVNDELVTAQQLQEIWKILGLDKLDPVDVTPTGIDSDSGDIDINFTGDGVTLTRQVRQ